jgi:hypothetical protein
MNHACRKGKGPLALKKKEERKRLSVTREALWEHKFEQCKDGWILAETSTHDLLAVKSIAQLCQNAGRKRGLI